MNPDRMPPSMAVRLKAGFDWQARTCLTSFGAWTLQSLSQRVHGQVTLSHSLPLFRLAKNAWAGDSLSLHSLSFPLPL